MTTAEAAQLIIAIVKVVVEHAPDVLEALNENKDWQELTGKVSAASGTPTRTEVAAAEARRRAGLPEPP